jgi:hypothetical protein
VLPRADAADALERGAERERAAVADLPGNRADGGVRLAQQVGGSAASSRRPISPSSW